MRIGLLAAKNKDLGSCQTYSPIRILGSQAFPGFVVSAAASSSGGGSSRREISVGAAPPLAHRLAGALFPTAASVATRQHSTTSRARPRQLKAGAVRGSGTGKGGLHMSAGSRSPRHAMCDCAPCHGRSLPYRVIVTPLVIFDPVAYSPVPVVPIYGRQNAEFLRVTRRK